MRVRSHCQRDHDLRCGRLPSEGPSDQDEAVRSSEPRTGNHCGPQELEQFDVKNGWPFLSSLLFVRTQGHPKGFRSWRAILAGTEDLTHPCVTQRTSLRVIQPNIDPTREPLMPQGILRVPETADDIRRA